MTLEQKRAVAMANARLRLQERANPPDVKTPSESFVHPPTEQRGILRKLDDAARSVASGMTFGFADELAAGANTLVGKLTGDGQSYEENVAAERARDKQIPATTAIPGEIAGGIATGTGLGRAGVTFLRGANPTYGSMMGRGAAEGAAYGAAYGAGSGEDARSRLEGAAYGAGVGGLTGGATGAAGARMARTAPPTADALRTQSHAAYQAAENAGVVVAPQSFGNAVNDIAVAARDAGIDRTIHPRATAALNRLTEAAGNPQSLQEMDTLRRVVRAAAASNEPDERRIARIIIDRIDNYVNSLQPGDLLSGNAPQATAALNQARDLWGRARKGEVIEDLIERAQNRASQFSGSGYENALRTEFRQLAQNARRMRTFTDEEQNAIRRVARGGPVENFLRFIGKLAPRGVVSGGFHLGVGTVASPLAAGATMLAGEAGRRGATAMTARNARLAGEMMRAGGNTFGPRTLTPTELAVLRAGTIGGASGPGIFEEER